MIHPGEQLVKSGRGTGCPSTRAFFSRVRSSVPSSMIVRSAVKFVSNTLSNPIWRSAVTIFPVTSVPAGMPKHSPSAARMAGAVCTSTVFFGSSIAAQTLSISSASLIAPTGQTAAHCPHCTHTTSDRFEANAGPMTDWKPRFCGNMAATPCVWPHTVTQRRQRMHLPVSRTSAGVLASTVRALLAPA